MEAAAATLSESLSLALGRASAATTRNVVSDLADASLVRRWEPPPSLPADVRAAFGYVACDVEDAGEDVRAAQSRLALAEAVVLQALAGTAGGASGLRVR